MSGWKTFGDWIGINIFQNKLVWLTIVIALLLGFGVMNPDEIVEFGKGLGEAIGSAVGGVLR